MICPVLLFILLGCKHQDREDLKLNIDFKSNGLVSVPVAFVPPSSISSRMKLVERGNGTTRVVPTQIHNGKIWFIANPKSESPGEVHYYLKKTDVHTITTPIAIKTEKGDLKLSYQGKPKVTYRYGMTFPPSGVDSVYKKSGYIHPIITKKGDTLTRIQPSDHYHHYGLWGPWTHTRIDTTRVDFWNLGQGMGTVLFHKFLDTLSGGVFASFTAKQHHIDKKTKASPQVALHENLNVKLWDLDRPDRYMLDYTTTFSSPLQNGILFEAYRYGGGLGLRFTERWHKDNSQVLTSEGKDRSSADGTKARWCMVTGESSDRKGTNGILFMSHPKNRSHPEPMRVWPLDANNGRGDMFFEFCPIRNEAWKIAPDREYFLYYRMVVFDGNMTSEEAEAYWQSFANPPEVVLPSIK